MSTLPFRQIKLTQGYFAIVDHNDFEWLNAHRWFAQKSKHGIIATCWLYFADKKRQRVKMHRLIMNAPEKKDVDHINHNRLDNRRSNLRLVNDPQNAQNARKWQVRTSSRYKGVVWNKEKSGWVSRIQHLGKSIYLGCFDSEVTAAQAYNKRAKSLFGEFACLNSITTNTKGE